MIDEGSRCQYADKLSPWRNVEYIRKTITRFK